MTELLSASQTYIESLRTNASTKDLADLSRDLLAELRGYFRVASEMTDDELLQICRRGSEALVQEWRDGRIDARDPSSLLSFYSKTQAYCYELVGFDLAAPEERKSLLAELVATLKRLNLKRGLDFGSGVGSTGIYLIRHGLDCAFADVSETNLGFIRMRLANRGLDSQTFLLPGAQIPQGSQDFVLAMDVLEHVVDPIDTLRKLRSFLRPGGVLVFNIIAGHSEEDPLHIMHDSYLIRKRIRGLGFKKIGQVGEFKLYSREDRAAPVNRILQSLDSAFWSIRIALKGQ